MVKRVIAQYANDELYVAEFDLIVRLVQYANALLPTLISVSGKTTVNMGVFAKA
jgi:hypothetical protein